MVLIAIRNLWQEKTRLVISVAGVSFAVALILVLVGIYAGAQRQFTMVVERNPADLFVSRAGITDFFHGISIIEQEHLRRLASEPGVQRVVPVVTQRTVLARHGKRFDTIIFSTVADDPMGAPWRIVAGVANIGRGDVVLSDLLAEKLAIVVGDHVTIQGKKLRVTGLAADASSFGNHYAWVSLDEARVMVDDPDSTNFAYVDLDDRTNERAAARTLQAAIPQLSVLDKRTFLANNRAELEESFLPIIRAIVAIAMLIGIAVMALTIYTLTVDKSREYGILKAIGVRNMQLYRIVLVQAVAATVLGLVFGAGLAMLAAVGLEKWINLVPVFTVGSYLQVAAIGLAMGLMASLLPVWRLLRIDPAEVFRA